MGKKKLLLPAIAVAAALVVVLAGAAFAQTATPNATTPPANGQQTAPAQGAQPPLGGLGRGGMPFGLGGLMGGGKQDWTEFDATASALKLTPTQLFEQLHSGKTLSDIAQAQGVDINTVQQAAQNARIAAQKAAIAQAVKDGTMTQAQADWLLQGLQNGWGGFGGFGGHGRGHGGPGGPAAPNAPAPTAPSSTTPSSGTQS